MMKKSQDFDEPRKKSTAAAEHFTTSQSIFPPEFASSRNVQEQASSATETETVDQGEVHKPENNDDQDQKGYATISANKLFNAVAYGHNVFKQTAVLSDVSIQGSRAIGPAGCLKAPDVSSLIRADLSSEMGTPENNGMAKAVSKVLGNFIDDWRRGFNIPGVMWFPAFDYFPGPMAPPMPNIPTQLRAMPSFFEFYLTRKENMIREIFSELPRQMDNDVNRNTIETFSDKTVNYFENWLTSSYIMGVMGMGRIPGFSPPFSYGGPVHGQALPKTGVLI